MLTQKVFVPTQLPTQPKTFEVNEKYDKLEKQLNHQAAIGFYCTILILFLSVSSTKLSRFFSSLYTVLCPVAV